MKTILLLVAAVLIVIVILRFYLKPTRDGGFLDRLKNPGLEPDWEARRGSLERDVEQARGWEEAEFRRAVHHFVFEVPTQREGWDEYQLLDRLAERVHPYLLDILRDGTLRPKLVRVTGKDYFEEAPINRVCDLLESRPPADCVPLLTPFLEGASEPVRKDLLRCIAATGAESALPYVQLAFADEDEYTRATAIIGATRAAAAGRVTPAVAAGIFQLGADLYLKADLSDGDVADLLVALDAERASAFLTSADVFHADFRLLDAGLKALRKRGLKPDRSRSLDLLQSLENKELKYPVDYALGEILGLVGSFSNPFDIELLERHLSSTNSHVASGAAEGLLALHGLGDFREQLFARIEASGVSSLTAGQLRWYAVHTYDAEVNNGGHSQYFFNSAGMCWEEALTGLQAMGALERHGLLSEAIALFGGSAPARDSDARKEQLARIIRRKEKAFDEIDQRYFGAKEPLAVLMARYVFKNAHEFR